MTTEQYCPFTSSRSLEVLFAFPQHFPQSYPPTTVLKTKMKDLAFCSPSALGIIYVKRKFLSVSSWSRAGKVASSSREERKRKKLSKVEGGTSPSQLPDELSGVDIAVGIEGRRERKGGRTGGRGEGLQHKRVGRSIEWEREKGAARN